MHGQFERAQVHGFGAQVGRQVVVPAPRVILKDASRYAELIGQRVQLVAGIGQQMAELGESQPRVGVAARRIYVGGQRVSA